MALRALKQRMHSLGEAMVDAALTGRLMAMAMPPDGRPVDRPAAVAVPGRVPGGPDADGRHPRLHGGRPRAAAFFAGGEPQTPGPKVTPAVDTFLIQHAIVTGDLPVTPPAGGTASGSPASTGPGRRASRVQVGVSAGGIAAAAIAGAQARAASRRVGPGPGRASGQLSRGQGSGQVSAGR